MSEKIDWSKAPEGAMVLLKHVRDGAYAVSESYGDEAKTWHWPDPRYSFPLMPSMWRIVAERPATPSWSGEGLPPVGVDLQWFSSVYGWIGGKVVAHDEQTTIVRHNDGYEGCYLHNLKPCKTPEQIAADERERFAQELVTAMGKGGGPNAIYQARRMYDLGYRKP